ncbi:hypothetical protein OA90_08280 [Labrenzia sp. OB1]|nr:hypothetical protein OA90_08280 [Labrenzia sp. OB1]
MWTKVVHSGHSATDRIKGVKAQEVWRPGEVWRFRRRADLARGRRAVPESAPDDASFGRNHLKAEEFIAFEAIQDGSSSLMKTKPDL